MPHVVYAGFERIHRCHERHSYSFNIGREFNVVTVSIWPRYNGPEDAAAAKARYIKRYRRAGAAEGWHFLTGKKDQIDALAQAVGFRYAWDPGIQQYAHASGIMLLTPDGRVAQYYYGIEYAPRDIQLGLIEASKGKIGTWWTRSFSTATTMIPARPLWRRDFQRFALERPRHGFGAGWFHVDHVSP